jgi:hypothetical protein
VAALNPERNASIARDIATWSDPLQRGRAQSSAEMAPRGVTPGQEKEASTGPRPWQRWPSMMAGLVAINLADVASELATSGRRQSMVRVAKFIVNPQSSDP